MACGTLLRRLLLSAAIVSLAAGAGKPHSPQRPAAAKAAPDQGTTADARTETALGRRVSFSFIEAPLVDAISGRVSPESWESVGGPGSIIPWSQGDTRALVISQTQDVHEEILRLLEEVRKHVGKR
jgi:hypothetical protein